MKKNTRKLSLQQENIIRKLGDAGCLDQTAMYTSATKRQFFQTLESLLDRGIVGSKKLPGEETKLFLSRKGWQQLIELTPEPAGWMQGLEPFTRLKSTADELATMALYLQADRHPALAAYRVDMHPDEVQRIVTRLEIRAIAEQVQAKFGTI